VDISPCRAFAGVIGELNIRRARASRRGPAVGFVVTMPWVNRPANGSPLGRHQPAIAHRAGEEAGIEQVQHRVLDAADILIDRQPIVGAARVKSGPLFCGSVKRAKYQLESTKVSSVSVSRTAALPQDGQGTCFQVGCLASGLPACVKVGILPAAHRQLIVRNRNNAAFLAMDRRDRAAPIALAAHAPIAQPPDGRASARLDGFEFGDGGGDRFARLQAVRGSPN
jgi:hypothetical protein